tara:strand:- start:642 stop:962 length:321 start_codon:yes stop_codon:yes gene_type:complete
MIEHNESFTQFSYIDKNGNMNNITNKCPIELCKNMRRLFGDNMFDETLINKETEDIYDYIIEKIYKTPEYLDVEVIHQWYERLGTEETFKSKLKIAFNKLFFKMIR